jgi:thioredoxin-like negative regulator of GroEL
MTPDEPASNDAAGELASLVAELEQAEAYEQRLRQLIADARDQLAAGNASVALSMLNAALSDIDAAADVVASRPSAPK